MRDKISENESKKPKKKKRFLRKLLKYLILIAILLLLIWKFLNNGSGLGIGGGAAQSVGLEVAIKEENTFLQLTVTEDKIYQDGAEVSLEDLKDSLLKVNPDEKIILKDDKAINSVFNEVKNLLESHQLKYMIE